MVLKFYANNQSGSSVNITTKFSAALAIHGVINVTIESCEFSGISKHCVHCIGSDGVLPKLFIISSNFLDNDNTAVNVERCSITFNNVTFYKFYNNVNVNSGYINDGGAIRVCNGTVNMSGRVLFCYNRAGKNGGAIYLKHSVLFASQGSLSSSITTQLIMGEPFILVKVQSLMLHSTEQAWNFWIMVLHLMEELCMLI